MPTSCLVAGGDTVIGGWTTASLRQGSLLSSAPKTGYQTAAIVGGAWTQVSRLGMPLVNEVVIGLPDKDKFNGSKPKDDGQFATYVTNPTLPALVEIALGTPNIAPTNFPRTDLVTTFLTGIAGVNQPKAFSGLAGDRSRLGDAAPQHGDRADRGSVAEPARPARRTARPRAAGPRRLSRTGAGRATTSSTSR